MVLEDEMKAMRILGKKGSLLVTAFLLPILAACSLIGGTFEMGIESVSPPEPSFFFMDQLRPVIDAFLVGSIEDRIALVSYTTTPCSNAEGLGGPPKCEADETEGTLVEVLPVLSGEASYSGPDNIQNAMDFNADALYAVYRVAEGGQGEDYWPAGEYGILFVSQDFPAAFTIFVEDARIVRVNYHLGYFADQVLETLPPESVILSPEFAAQWMSENYSPETLPSESAAEAGVVSGKICYPSEFIPEMTVFFQESTAGDITELTILENQSTYNIDLTSGRYTAFAYLNSGASLGGAYTQMVLCGLAAECSDHTLVEFDVQNGETVKAIDICDWYAPESLPPDPRADQVPLAGMIYTIPSEGYYLLESNGNARQLFDGMGLAIPYTGSYGVYFENVDLHAIDLFGGGGFNLTNTPDLIETSYHFEVGLPEELLFTAMADTDIAGPGYTGGLYIINIDGTNQRTIDSEHNAGNYSASPDGQSIAYGMGETAYLFTWETGVQTFDPLQYGMDSPGGLGIASPSWSPAGDKLSWFVSGSFGGQGDNQGFGIFDLQAKTFQLIHPHQMPAGDAFPPAAKWSPDGEWLAISTFDVDQSRNGVWLVNTLNPQQEFFMGSFSNNPVFGPWGIEKKILAYYRYDESAEGGRAWLYDLVSGEHRPTSLPLNAQAVAWW